MKITLASVKRRPLVFATAVTLGFVLLIAAGNGLGGGRDDASGIAIEGLTRVAVALAACGVAVALGWAELGFSAPHGARPWTMLLLPFVYLGALYPLFFTGSWGPNLKDPGITALVAASSFGAGFAEELIFRGLMFGTLLAAWSGSGKGLARAAVASSLFFSLIHILNALVGHQLLRVAAQVAWAFLLGIAFAYFVRLAGSVWPAAVFHGTLDAIVATNRMGKTIVLSPGKAVWMVLASAPVFVYAVVLARRRRLVGTEATVVGGSA
jgi:membrane protease YdiL (CAAX protease family)